MADLSQYFESESRSKVPDTLTARVEKTWYYSIFEAKCSEGRIGSCPRFYWYIEISYSFFPVTV